MSVRYLVEFKGNIRHGQIISKPVKVLSNNVLQIEDKLYRNSFCWLNVPRSGSGRAARESLLIFDGPLGEKCVVGIPRLPKGVKTSSFFAKNLDEIEKNDFQEGVAENICF